MLLAQIYWGANFAKADGIIRRFFPTMAIGDQARPLPHRNIRQPSSHPEKPGLQ